ncbi:MAG TPA: fumarylacetoacetate hydrolase family protein [Capsulimonadaceae bacterium]|nr:fumarylacetoacetate hydrolase family protein [Capsulimonadaceae bacterium]
MKFICYREFDDPTEPIHPGVVIENRVLPLARVVAVAEAINPKGLTVPDDLYELIGLLSQFVEVVKELGKEGRLLEKIWQEVGVTLAAPLPRPNRIFCVGRNYSEHTKELGNEIPEEPVLFLKASTSVIAGGQRIVYPAWAEQVDFEGELAVVIGLAGKEIGESEAMRHVAGYTLFNDLTERTLQTRDKARGLPWLRSKSIDTFGPLGPALITADEIRDPHNLELTTEVNGEVRQRANTGEMMHKIPALISYISKYFALESGDVIATGTPAGVGPVQPGDTVSVTIPQIGTLTNTVVSAHDV